MKFSFANILRILLYTCIIVLCFLVGFVLGGLAAVVKCAAVSHYFNMADSRYYDYTRTRWGFTDHGLDRARERKVK